MYDLSGLSRLMTMVVSGSTAQYQAAMSRLHVRVKEAIVERKTVLDRKEQLALREQKRDPDESEEEVFILDPSVLTVQDLQMEFRLPKLSLTLHAVYHTRPEIRSEAITRGVSLLHSTPVPVLSVECKGLRGKIDACNNPWIARIQLAAGKFRVRDMQSFNHSKSQKSVGQRNGSSSSSRSDRKNGTRSSSEATPIVSLRGVSAAVNLTQTSTMSRMIDGKLDSSCFDWNATVSMFPVTFVVNSASFHSAKKDNGALFWQRFRLLSHLWAPREHWAMGSSVSQISVSGRIP
jgi:hypothetical protein